MHSQSKVKISTYLVKKSGTIQPTNGLESYNVSVGSMKFNIELIDWDFCGSATSTCGKNQVGDFVDVDIEIKGKGASAIDVGQHSFNSVAI